MRRLLEVSILCLQIVPVIDALGESRSQNRKLRALPESWLNRMLNILSGEIDESCESLCATRRSAGVPFLILVMLLQVSVSFVLIPVDCRPF